MTQGPRVCLEMQPLNERFRIDITSNYISVQATLFTKEEIIKLQQCLKRCEITYCDPRLTKLKPSVFHYSGNAYYVIGSYAPLMGWKVEEANIMEMG